MNAVHKSEFRLVYPGLPEALEGYRIAHITDLHFRAGGISGFEDAASAIINEFAPDLLAFTGDAVYRSEAWYDMACWLGELCPGACKVCVPGNWDYKYGWGGRFERAMEQAGMERLNNRGVRFEKGSAALWVAGIDDMRLGRPDPAAAWAGSSSGEFVLALAHNPDTLLRLNVNHRFDLMLCGHTHGGQVRIPGYGALITSTWLGKQFESGLSRLHNNAFVYVNRGLGEGRIRLRLFCPREVAFFTLTAGAANEKTSAALTTSTSGCP